MYFKSIIFKNPKSQALSTIHHLQKIDLFAKTRAECQIYAEGQRRYVESLSAYARQFLGLMSKPDVDTIEIG